MDSDRVLDQLSEMAESPDAEIDLGRGALLIAATEYPDLDVNRELARLDLLAEGAAGRLAGEDDPLFCVNTISEYLFDELEFQGNRDNYYDPQNSYLNDVIELRRGIPITLSLVYMEVAKRLNVPVQGIGMPGHFLVCHRDIPDLFIDPFHRGILLSTDECAERHYQINNSGVAWDPAFLSPTGNLEILARIIRNLKVIYLRRSDYARTLTMINSVIAIAPEYTDEIRHRGVVNYRLGNYADALDDLNGYLSINPYATDVNVVRRLVSQIESRLGN